MGDFTVTCMASGLPIYRGTETVLLFVTPKHHEGCHRGGCHVEDMFNFLSWPIFLKMDDYGLHTFLGQVPTPDPNAMKDEQASLMTDQLAWRMFWPHIQGKEGGKPTNEWVHDIIHGRVGHNEYGEHFVKVFGRKLSRVALTYIRKDVYDWLVKLGTYPDSEFEREMQEACKAPIEERPSSIAWGDFMSHTMHRLLLSKRDHYIPSITDDEHKQLMKMTSDLRALCYGLDTISRPIIPAVNLAPQEGFHNRKFRKAHASFHRLCLRIIDREGEKLDAM